MIFETRPLLPKSTRYIDDGNEAAIVTGLGSMPRTSFQASASSRSPWCVCACNLTAGNGKDLLGSGRGDLNARLNARSFCILALPEPCRSFTKLVTTGFTWSLMHSNPRSTTVAIAVSLVPGGHSKWSPQIAFGFQFPSSDSTLGLRHGCSPVDRGDPKAGFPT